MNFPSQIFFNNISHGHRAAILKKTFLWLLPFYMVVATYSYYEKVCGTMHTAIVSCPLKFLCDKLASNLDRAVRIFDILEMLEMFNLKNSLAQCEYILLEQISNMGDLTSYYQFLSFKNLSNYLF